MEKVKVGIIGSGFAANLHVKAYQRCANAEVIAAAAIDNLENFCRQNKIPKAYDDYREVLKKEDIEMVSVCVPNYLHKEVVCDAANAGKHIVCEKPLAITLEDCDKMIETCQDNKVKLMYAEDWIFAPALIRAKNIYKEGAIGDIVYIKAKESHGGSHSLYAQKLKYCGGGAMIHLGIHPAGLVTWFNCRLCCRTYNYFRGCRRIFTFLSGDGYCGNITCFFPTTSTLSAAQIYATLSLLKNKECCNLIW